VEVRIIINDEVEYRIEGDLVPRSGDDSKLPELRYKLSLTHRGEELESPVEWDGRSPIPWTTTLHDDIASLIDDAVGEAAQRATEGSDAAVERPIDAWYPQVVATTVDHAPVSEVCARQWFLLFGYLERASYERNRDESAIFGDVERLVDWSVSTRPSEPPVLGTKRDDIPWRRLPTRNRVILPPKQCIVCRAPAGGNTAAGEISNDGDPLDAGHITELELHAIFEVERDRTVTYSPSLRVNGYLNEHTEPDLIVEIVNERDKSTRRVTQTTWRVTRSTSLEGLTQPHFPRLAADAVQIGGLDEEAQEAFEHMDALAREGSSQLRHAFQDFGKRLYDNSPLMFQRAYWCLWRCLGLTFTIQLVCNEPFVPWECMIPKEPNSSDWTPRERQALMFAHPIARVLHDVTFERGRISGRDVAIGRGARLRDETEIETEEEVEAEFQIDAEFSDVQVLVEADSASQIVRVPTKTREFERWLESDCNTRIAWIHFVGHGDCDNMPIIKLDGEWVGPSIVKRAEVNQGGCLAIVMLNACHGQSPTANKLLTTSWAEAFLDRGFRGVIVAARWIDSAVARQFGVAVLKRVLVGATVAEAVRDARSADATDTTIFYVYYGPVMAALEPSNLPRARHT